MSDAESEASARPVVDALRASSEHLQALVAPLDDDTLAGPAYPTEWTIADVMSHVGSGAVIMQRRVDDARRGLSTPDHFAPSVWDEWNAKSARAKTDDGLAADRALVELLEQLVDAAGDEDPLEFEMGPMTLGLSEFVGLRLNEHTLHAWDIEVALDPAATLPEASAAITVDNLGLIMSYTARPTGDTRTIHVQTTDPTRSFTVTLTPESGTCIADDDATATPDVTLPAEAWVRLVYGRLDAEHTPTFTGDATALETLRKVFPGP
ncbi:MAG TPA: maleylpyruvate isomerase family mycothiol-dependent enzyme [Acidimicrobiia bacterium]|nr:maleylpyruvate isomerase family mycothiol-dependent enzyme [Acidimicrobiia bacterium]